MLIWQEIFPDKKGKRLSRRGGVAKVWWPGQNRAQGQDDTCFYFNMELYVVDVKKLCEIALLYLSDTEGSTVSAGVVLLSYFCTMG
jgi:hypothetical protein